MRAVHREFRHPRSPFPVVLVLVASAWVGFAAPAHAQTTLPGDTLRDTLLRMSRITTAGTSAGEAIATATALEVATAPLGTSSGGFTYRWDPATRAWSRAAPSFGPSFAERAATGGRGKFSLGATLLFASYDKIDEFDLNDVPAATFVGGVAAGLTSSFSLDLSSMTTNLFASVGVTDRLDIGIALPITSVSLSGSVERSRAGTTVVQDSPKQTSTGLGDMGIVAKFRFWQPADSSGGVAALVNFRLPTGDEDGLRGLGVTRTLLGVVASGTAGRIAPHVDFGYEIWSSGITVPTSDTASVEVKDQLRFAAGTEVIVHPRVTVNADFLIRSQRGAGKVGLTTINFPAVNGGGSVDTLVMLPEGYTKALFVPGLKWNVGGNALVSVNLLLSLNDGGLRANMVPSFGFDWTF